MNTYAGVTFVAAATGISAIGANGATLWSTAYSLSTFVGGSVTSPFVLGRYVVVIQGAAIVAFDQYSGAYAFTRNIAASNAALTSPICGQPLQGALYNGQPVIQGDDSLLIIPELNPCVYVVRSDFNILSTEIIGYQAATVLGGDYYVITSATVARINGTSGQLIWQQALYGPLSFAYGFLIHASANLLYVVTTGYGLACYTVQSGALLWGTTSYVGMIRLTQPLAGDDIVVLGAGSGYSNVVLLTTVLQTNGSAVPVPVWSNQFPNQISGGAVVNGVLIILNGPAAGFGQSCEGCITGFNVANGDSAMECDGHTWTAH
jgi:hypothetical protein